VAPSEEFLKERVDRAKRDVEADLTQLRTEIAALGKKVGMVVVALVGVVVLFKVGRRILRRSGD
jgi:hypothetical protein